MYFNFRKLNLKKGKILDKENNLGIKGAIIRAYIDDALVDMKMSNSQGEVRMRVKENTQDLVVTGLGYKTANEQRNIQKEKGDFVPIYLEKDLSGSKVKFGLEK